MASENENENRETLADLLAEMRREVGDGEDTYCGKRIIRRMDDVRVRQYCDRIGAAAKRDEERAIEHATRHAEAVARDNCRDCVNNPKGKNYEGGNAAAMREALENSNGLLEELAAIGEWGESAREQIAENNAALSAPARSCDVGTAEEQDERFRDFCPRFIGGTCTGCELVTCGLSECAIAWAQMPYEAEEGGAK